MKKQTEYDNPVLIIIIIYIFFMEVGFMEIFQLKQCHLKILNIINSITFCSGKKKDFPMYTHAQLLTVYNTIRKIPI